MAKKKRVVNKKLLGAVERLLEGEVVEFDSTPPYTLERCGEGLILGIDGLGACDISTMYIPKEVAGVIVDYTLSRRNPT